MEAIIESLKSPSCLDTIRDDIERTLSKSSVTDEKRSTMSIRLLVEINRNLNNESWKNSVNPRTLNSTYFTLSRNVTYASEVEYKNFLIVTRNIVQFLIKKDILENDPIHLNFIFKNEKLKPKHEHYKMYWNLIVESINTVKPKNEKKTACDILHSFTCYIIELIRISNLIQFCQSHFSWIIRKLYLLFNSVIPHDLNIAYERIFETLNLLDIPDGLFDDKQTIVESIFNDVLLSFSLIIQTISDANYDNNRSIIVLLKFATKVFSYDDKLLNFFKALSSLHPVFTIPMEKFSPDFDKLVTNFCYKIDKLKKYPRHIFQEFVLIFRKSFISRLSKWTETSGDLWKKHVSSDLQISLMRLFIVIMKELKNCDKQNVKCTDCTYKSGSHDALQLATYSRVFLVNSIRGKIDVSELVELHLDIFNIEVEILENLKQNGCTTWKTLWRNVEKKYHNDAILVHSIKAHRLSLDIFNAYMQNCTKLFHMDNSTLDHHGFARALYNMAICQLDLFKFKDALRSCYLSMALDSIDDRYVAQFESSIKATIQIKTKLMDKHNSSDKLCKYDKQTKKSIVCECLSYVNDLLSSNAWSFWCESTDSNIHTLYRKILSNFDFGKLLFSDFEMHFEIWFSTATISGMCKSITQYFDHKNDLKNRRIISDFNEYDLLINMGKMVTLLNTHSLKLRNEEIANFVKFTKTKYEQYYNNIALENGLNLRNRALSNLLLANILSATYEITLFEKLNADKFLPSPIASNTLQNEPNMPHPDDECNLAPTHLSLRIMVEKDIVEPLFEALELWKKTLLISEKVLKEVFTCPKNKLYMEKSIECMEMVMQILCLRGLDAHSLIAADVILSYATIANNRLSIIRSVGYIIQNFYSQTPEIDSLIEKSNKITKSLLVENEKSPVEFTILDYVYEYMLNLSIYYHNCNRMEKGILVLGHVQNKILDYLTKHEDKLDKIHSSYAKLLDVQSLYICSDVYEVYFNNDLSHLTSLTNAYMEYSEIVKLGNFGSQVSATLHLWISSGISAGKICLLLGLPRRSRSILKSLLPPVQRLLLPRRTAEILLILANTDLLTECYDDCKVKLDTMRFIMEENLGSVLQITKKSTDNVCKDIKLHDKVDKHITLEDSRIFEMVLDIPYDKHNNDNINGSPTFHPSLFTMPTFVDHQNTCFCNMCTSINVFNLTLGMMHLETNLYCRTEEAHAAQSFLNGTFKMMQYLNPKLNYVVDKIFNKLKNFPFENVDMLSSYKNLVFSKCQFLTDAGFYLIKENNFDKAELLNNQAVNFLSTLPSHNHLLKQSIYEQKLYLQSRSVNEEFVDPFEEIEHLNAAFMNDLLISSPKKNESNIGSFKTPSAKSVKVPTRTLRVRNNKTKSLFADNDDENEIPKCNIPKIKIDLENEETDETEIKINTSKQNGRAIVGERVEITPAPKLRKNKMFTSRSECVDNSSPPSLSMIRNSVNKTVKTYSSRQVKTKLESVENTKDSIRKIATSETKVKAKVSSKDKVLSDDPIVKKYPSRKRL